MNILIKYPGSKGSLLNDIKDVFNRSSCSRLVDVFGGSGIVLLNLDAGEKIYNDINLDLINLFKTLKYKYNDLYKMITALKNREVFDYYKYNIDSMGKNDVERAFKTFYLLNTTFGGQGNTYIKHDKSKFNLVSRIINNMENLRINISSWIIENLDYKYLIEKYDGKNTFFYIDPPYNGKRWYDFDIDSYKTLNSLISKMQGKYLMNFIRDDGIINIFGNPAFIRKYMSTGSSYRYYYFYTNVR
ncbi:DNA adenine methylase [Picrophilus oshimae]|uniref:site-specific DNA-methyltransferase (adenine-specific) n=1 Tax=Picrophilus torridus (strain ATCC 700027 / DSM 9790 / JCM 10055 / NBRC 100828 / KAW 2/3) TaxID=1122961 RepID=Q6L041_PICTO|nr:DNA adenine methylase [Picrophilus oshimae]AAT43661.1 DNA adenine methylase [Picrophilus oshimae DSM 9789]